MHRAIDKLKITPKHLAIDGNKFKPYQKIMHSCIIKGDAKFMNIAAASILAKTHRDHLMHELDKNFPMYGWKKIKVIQLKNIEKQYLTMVIVNIIE